MVNIFTLNRDPSSGIYPHFEQGYTIWKQKKENYKLRKRLFGEHKASISTPKFGKFLY